MKISRPWDAPMAWSEAQTETREIAMAADAGVLAQIAQRLDLESMAELKARIRLRPWLDGIEISGEIEGRATRLCGLTLEPFDVTVCETLKLRALPAGSAHAPSSDDREIVIDLDADDPPDLVAGGAIDLGEYVIEAFALALDPFPRKPGAEFTPPADSAPISPFAALAALAKRESEA